jgi:hypothetical protein
MKQKIAYPNIGEVSSGTLRSEDLLDTFSSELRYYTKRLRLTRDQRKRFHALLNEANALHPICDLGDVVNDLQDALNEIAPPHSYFGSNEGDGASFGFWPIVDNDELPRLTAGDPIPREHWGEDVYLVNDHGNVSCGHVNKRGEFTEYWSIV